MSSSYPIPPPAIPAKENLYIEWPQLVIQKILGKITAEESEDMISALLNCRLVDTYWNEIIEEDFMKKLAFIIRKDPIEFLNLPIVQKGKCRSIKFTNFWLMEPKVKYAATKNFIDAISNVIEKVQFSFEERTLKLEFELFKFILGVCTNLQELITMDELIRRRMSSSGILLEQITDEIEILSSNKIHSLVVDLTGCGFTFGSSIGLATLLSKLPQLHEIKLIGSCRSHLQTMLLICTQLIAYLDKFGSGLKKLALPTMIGWFDEETIDTFNTLLILCGKKSVVIEGEICYVELNALLNLPEISTAQLASSNQKKLQNPLFKGKVIGGFNFDEESSAFTNASLDLLGELDIRSLDIYFTTDILSGQLTWIGKLKQLELLNFIPMGDIGDRDYKDDEDEVRTLNQASLEEFRRVFSAGFPTLKRFRINGDIFSSTHIFHWAQFFPNLTKLDMRALYYTTNDIIAQLTALESLSELHLFGLEKLEDIAFTADCVDKYSQSEASLGSASSSAAVFAVGPAVACFKSLKFLKLFHCSSLTNDCVINGIGKCKTLDKIQIIRCINMTKECLKFLECEACFIKHESSLL